MVIKQIVACLFRVGLMVNAGLFISQALKIFKTKSAKGIWTMTFVGFKIQQLLGIIHGYLQGDLYLRVGMMASFLACGAVTSLAIIYRG